MLLTSEKIYYTKIIIAKVRKLLEAINLTYINRQGFKYVKKTKYLNVGK